jgi:hypothetical protein
VNAETIARALGGHRAGAGWTACCPAHNDRTPSLSLGNAQDGKVLVRCHAGCDQERVIGALRSRGLWSENGSRPLWRPTSQIEPKREPDRDDDEPSAVALAVWRSTERPKGTLVETYLGWRGLRLLEAPTLRFHPGLKHPSGRIWPAMVALVTRGSDGKPVATHRTYPSSLRSYRRQASTLSAQSARHPMSHPNTFARSAKLIECGYCRRDGAGERGRRPLASGEVTLVGLESACAELIVAPPVLAGALQRRGRA